MPRYLLVACALACLTLAACATTPATLTADIAVARTEIARAQSLARTACGILPTAESVTALFAASSGTFATAESIADLACRALTSGAAYAAGKAPLPPVRPRKGQSVTGTAVVGGRAVPVSGTVVAPTAR